LQEELLRGIADLQSPYLYLQAAGSDGADGSASGIHLRWDFLRSLGESHLPKGDLAVGREPRYPASHGFNKADDYVRLLRVPYVRFFPHTINFSTDQPSAVVETGPERAWRFIVATHPARPAQEVVIRFVDVARYDAVRAAVPPGAARIEFLSRYPGVLEAEVTGQLCFAITVSTDLARESREAVLRMEAISVAEKIKEADLWVSCRKRFFRYFRFDYARCTPREIQLETYLQFVDMSLSQKEAEWQAIEHGFSLTDLDDEAYRRLEDQSTLKVDGKWPRYVGANVSSGLFTVSVPNYRARWDPTRPPSNERTDASGLRQGVIAYLRRSMDPANPRALASLPADNSNDGGAFDISYLQMLKLVALDFHIARMLGLGWIDSTIVRESRTKYVYLAIYRTLAALEPNTPASATTHIYMTLPTSRTDYRLPPAPVQEPPTFGVTFDDGTATPASLTDANGYTPLADSRLINLHIQPYDTVQEFGPFFKPSTEFCSCEATKPVFYGAKHKLVSETNYRVPELSWDAEFRDPSGVAEVAPLLSQASAAAGQNPPVFTHEETENGKHRYVFYGVNWFSRPSPLSNPQDVATLLPVRNTLLPPLNFAVQLIQPEDPLILTTSLEQQKLAALAPGDSTLVRCTFDWNHNHYIPQRFSQANAYADKVQLYFRQQPPRAVQGEIKSVSHLSASLVEVRTKGYELTSVSPPQTISPVVGIGDEPRFTGSSFAANQVLYIVESVAQSTVPGEGAIFRVQKLVQTAVAELDNNNQFSASSRVSVPSIGERFLAVENMNEPRNWEESNPPVHDLPLSKEVTLINFLDNGQLYRETVSYPDGSQETLNVGGIRGTTNIVELEDVDPNNPSTTPVFIPQSKTGIFKISFLSYQLPNHPDSDVEWYKGTVRVPEANGGSPKVLQVWNIDASSANLELIACDPTFNVDQAYVPLPDYSPIQTTGTVEVSFHPAYRVYLKAQSGVLDRATTLPGPAESTKQSFLAARSRNSVLGQESNLTPPVVLQSRKTTAPLRPSKPAGPLFATRPDFFGKASWTMDTAVTVDSTREPYAFVFYRANERSILDTLYKAHPGDGSPVAPDTVQGIEEALRSLPAADTAFSSDRWRDLVNVENLHADLGFNEYATGGYRFPFPNNGAYLILGTMIAPFNGQNPPGASTTFQVGDSQMTMLEVVREAIDNAFLPLTESPVIYQFIKTGTRTSARKPVLRDANGDLLPFSSAAFDPSPMAVKYVSQTGDHLLRFTDYTLDGAATNIYFYYAKEMSDQMRFGPRSSIAGPIRLVNSYPAEAPTIARVFSIVQNPVLQIPTGVKLVVHPYIAAEGIRRFNLYRATKASDAASIRDMKLVRDYPAVVGVETEIFDDLSDLVAPPFGARLFYRVVALREIINERGLPEFVPSQPSKLARASIV
jgi:hypothetical protein